MILEDTQVCTLSTMYNVLSRTKVSPVFFNECNSHQRPAGIVMEAKPENY